MTELGTKNLEPGLNQAVQYGTGSDFEDFRIEQVTAIKKGVPCESSLFFYPTKMRSEPAKFRVWA